MTYGEMTGEFIRRQGPGAGSRRRFPRADPRSAPLHLFTARSRTRQQRIIPQRVLFRDGWKFRPAVYDGVFPCWRLEGGKGGGG